MKNNICSLTVVSIFILLSISSVYSFAEQSSGEQLYTANCAKCHGREGEGFLRLYPPIHDSRYLKEEVSNLPCIIRNGLRGEITVGDTTFNQVMPAIDRLSPEQMSQIITFLQQKWSHPVTELNVNKWLEECSSR